MNDLSNPQKNLVHNTYNPYRTPSESGASPRNSSNLNLVPQYGSQTLSSFGKVNNSLNDHSLHSHVSKQLPSLPGNSYEESVGNVSQDDDNTTTTSGSFTIQDDFQDDVLTSDAKDMFYKPDTFV